MSRLTDFPGPLYASRAAHDARREAAAKASKAEPPSDPDSDLTSSSDEGSGSEFPKHTGGGWYELSNGEKVQGQEAAETAEAKL